MKTPSPPLSSKLLVHGCPPKPSLPCPSHCPSPLCEPRPFHPAVPSRPPCVATLTTSQTTHIPPNGAVPPRLLLPLPPRCLEGPQGLRQARPPRSASYRGLATVAHGQLPPWGLALGCLAQAYALGVVRGMLGQRGGGGGEFWPLASGFPGDWLRPLLPLRRGWTSRSVLSCPPAPQSKPQQAPCTLSPRSP